MAHIQLAGIRVAIEEQGSGPDLLYLHPEHYFERQQPFIDALASSWHVLAPRHPGFDGQPPPADFRSVGDLAYLYLDLLAQLDLQKVMIVGSSLGGWIALEMAVRERSRIGSLALFAPLGAKLSAREVRDFADLNALPEDAALAQLFHDPQRNGPHYAQFDDQQMTALAIERQALAYYAWQPYLHNPALPRWLHRVDRPTLLLWGASDGLVSPAYARQLAKRLPRAELQVLPACGHYPQLEAPAAVIAALGAFAAANR